MTKLQSLIRAVDERTIAERVGLVHDRARNNFPSRLTNVGSYDEFAGLLGEYYQFHRRQTWGANVPKREAAGLAQQIVTQDYAQNYKGDFVTAYNNAHDGTDGGLRRILDIIADSLKQEAISVYVRDQFDRCVTPNNWSSKVAIMSEFFRHFGRYLDPTVRTDQPERYATDYMIVINSYVQGLTRTSSIFRRL